MKSLQTVVLLILACLAAVSAQAQTFNLENFRAGLVEQTGKVTVTAARTNLRGTPETQGVVVASVVRGETFELIGKSGAWYLVQSPKYVGWIQGSAIRRGESGSSGAPPGVPTGQDNSPFTEQYVGGDVAPTIFVRNSTAKRLTIVMGKNRYNVTPNSTQTIQVAAGNYPYQASVPGVRALRGNKEFRRGYKYTWEFYIVTGRR
jgi:hypothetical protein